jgi:hypothetical protein
MIKRSIALGILTFAAACGGDKAADTDTTQAAAATTPAAPAESTAPAVSIVSPAEGDSTSHDVTVVMQGRNVTIAKSDGAKVDGIGHYHVYLDSVPVMDTMPIPPTSTNVVHIGTGDSTYTFKGLTAGPHTLIAVLGYGNHVPFGATDTVHIVVKP